MTSLTNMQEVSPREVEQQFGLPEKSLESLKDRAAGFAGMVAAFCQRLGTDYRMLETLIASFQVGTSFPVRSIPLVLVSAIHNYNAPADAFEQLCTSALDLALVIIGALPMAGLTRVQDQPSILEADPCIFSVILEPRETHAKGHLDR